ncbi:MAG TPA: hypothetical protein VG267_14290 [Terracidiphilus sp.]|jgi:hypothetical protein|nr:hypothetical protein [Terracidiphilus sp.]
MHFHFPFTAAAILWTLTFAANLVLLVVLLGRERVARFPWFTASITLIALRLLVSKLLAGRLNQVAFATVIIVMLDVTAFVSLMVVVELGRRAFGKVRRASWLAGAFALMAAGAVVLRYWGTWPPWKTLSSSPPLQVLELLAQKAGLLADVEAIGIGVVIVALGYRCGAGWRTHVQRIAIGLSTASLAQVSVEAIWQAVARSAVVNEMNEYNRLIHLRDRLFNANNMVYIAVLAWWIVVLWRDESGATAAGGAMLAGSEGEAAAADEMPELPGGDATESPS